jgi:hypothetical protein
VTGGNEMLLISKSEKVNTEARWRAQAAADWDVLEHISDGKIKRPDDWWERTVKVFGLVEISAEEAGWKGVL